MTLGQQLKKARQKVGMTQEVLSARSGVSVFTIQATEQDRHTPALGSVLKLTRELKATFFFTEGTSELVVGDVTALRGELMEKLGRHR